MPFFGFLKEQTPDDAAISHLRNVAKRQHQKPFVFADGHSTDIPPEIAQKAINLYDTRRNPRHKAALSQAYSASLQSFKKAVGAVHEDLNERHLTTNEKKKREEIAQAIEREHPGIDMGKKMAIATAQAKKVSEEMDQNLEEAEYSAKAGREGHDLGKPGKNFSKIAKKAGKAYGSKAAGERVAGAILAKIRAHHEETEYSDEQLQEIAEILVRVNEGEQLDEISKAKLVRYIGAASSDKSHHAHEVGSINQVAVDSGTTAADRKERDQHNKQHSKRSGGIQKAAAKLAGTDGYGYKPKRPATNEEIELNESKDGISDRISADLKRHNVAHSHVSKVEYVNRDKDTGKVSSQSDYNHPLYGYQHTYRVHGTSDETGIHHALGSEGHAIRRGTLYIDPEQEKHYTDVHLDSKRNPHLFKEETEMNEKMKDEDDVRDRLDSKSKAKQFGKWKKERRKEKYTMEESKEILDEKKFKDDQEVYDEREEKKKEKEVTMNNKERRKEKYKFEQKEVTPEDLIPSKSFAEAILNVMSKNHNVEKEAELKRVRESNQLDEISKELAQKAMSAASKKANDAMDKAIFGDKEAEKQYHRKSRQQVKFYNKTKE